MRRRSRAAQTAKPRNIVFILTDDHRYDALGVMGHPLARTPNMDALAKGGAHMRNAFVTTALCSPSRASILTGTYAHTHGVVDNFTPIPPGLPNVGQLLKTAGYQTALIGKWHIGDADDAPQPGFDHWVSFRGQGEYLPRAGATMLNVDGRRVPQKGYITDELTDYAVEWLGKTTRDKPFFLYLSHKGVHANFVAGRTAQGLAEGRAVPAPATMAPAAAEAGTLPHLGAQSAQQLARRRVSVPLDAGRRRVLPPLHGDAARRRRQRRPRRRVAEAGRSAREHAGHLHGRQRLRVWRARPDRQAHGVRLVDARADARLRARPRGARAADRPGRRQHRHRADDARPGGREARRRTCRA